MAGVRVPLEASLRAFADELLRQAAIEREQAARAAAEAAAESREQADRHLAALREDTDQQIADVRRAAQEQIDAARRELETARAAERRLAEAELTALRQKADAEISDVRQRAAADAATLTVRMEAEIEDARRIAQAQVEDVQRALDERLAGVSRELEDARRQLDTAQRSHDEVHNESELLRRLLESVRSEMDEVRARGAEEAQALVAVQLAAASESHQRRLTEGIARARKEIRDHTFVETRTLLEGVRSLDEARSLGEVLERLALIGRRHLERLAVLVVKGDRLQEWRTAGFPERGSSDRLDVTIEHAGIAGEAVRTGRPAVRAVDVPPAEFPAGAEHRAAAALPVTIGGAVVAVVYIDVPRPDASLGGQWPAPFEVLARHASLLLEAITIQRAAGLLPPPGTAALPAAGSHPAGAGGIQ